jgi:hypothetical protein
MSANAVPVRVLNSGLGEFEIAQSTGVREETAQLPAGGTARSWYAAGPWHEPPPAGAAPDGDEILLATFGADLLALAQEKVIPLVAQSSGEPSDALGEALHTLRERVRAELSGLGIDLGPEGPTDVIVTPPGFASTSFNYTERRYMGLHVDQHDGLPLARRGQARRLCVVNIGWCHRYLNVFPHRVAEMCQALGIVLNGDNEPPSREVTARYFTAFPGSRILRIRLAPCQGYVFNTQDLPHDGSTPPAETPGVAFHAMGAWRNGD